MFKTVLVCTDGSEHAMRAAQRAAEIARQGEVRLLLLHVVNLTKELSPYVMPWQLELESAVASSGQKAEQETVLKRTAKVFEEAGLPYHQLRETGHPGSRIVQVAECEGADLIVIGSRGLSALKALLLGSVSNYVVHNAPCSVLLVR